RVDKSLLDAAVIRISRDLGFPEFTRGGVYLDVHYVEDILRTLGSPEDDYKNYFTARMLLLLESLPLFNTEVYNEVISDTIQTYYRDYHDHETDFHPVFLVNDIHRYWKTMCLNYEHIRNRKESMTEEQKNKAHLKNLKLKFSRLLTCYSMIVPILSTEGAVSSEVISRLVHQIPMERLTDLAKERSHLAPVIKTISEKYCWFLEQTGASEPDVLRWIGNRANRNTAFEEARSFGRQMHELASHAPIDPEKLKYLTV
ncbi:MAG: hypothetical protein SVR94_17145, partial [Pseudomonadota bacterium]|nr:hypothetical protein [Pseudomonadota bacterium]